MRTAMLAALTVAATLVVVPVGQAVPEAAACAPATVSVSGGASYEGTGFGVTPYTFRITATAAPGCPVVGSVAYATHDGAPGATAPSDYLAVADVVHFDGAPTTHTVLVPVTRDHAGEPDEDFTLRLSDPRGVVLGVARATGTLLDDDAPPIETIADGGKICWRMDGACPVGAGLTCGPVEADVTIHYRTIAVDRAALGYVPVQDGVVVVRRGQSRAEALIRLLPDARTTDERFIVEFFDPSAGTVKSGRTMVTIKPGARPL